MSNAVLLYLKRHHHATLETRDNTQNKEPAITTFAHQTVSLLALCLCLIASAQAQNLPTCPREDAKSAIYGARCDSIALLENPRDPASKEIPVYTLQIPAIRDSNKPAIFFIAGGPGQASTAMAAQFRHQFKALLIDHDFIFVDQRGTGKSNPLDCDIDFLSYADQTIDRIESITLKEHQRCLENLNTDLTRYTTSYAVEDLERIRARLGYEKIFLWGGSYGTRVVLEYLRKFPTSLAGVIMDGLAPVAISLPTYTARDASAALDRILRQCELDAACNSAFPNLRGGWIATLDRLAKEPERLALTHPRSGVSHEVYIDDVVLSSWMRLILYSREISPLAPLMMHQSGEGNYSTLFSIVANSYDSLNEQMSELMQTAILCAEDHQWADQTTDATQAMDTLGLIRLPPKTNFEKLCALYPAKGVEADYFKPVERDIPALLLSGHYDPVTPARWAELAKQPLSRSQHIIVPGGHHIVSRLGCLASIIEDFIDKPASIGTLDDTCVKNIRAADFFIDSAGPALEAKHD